MVGESPTNGFALGIYMKGINQLFFELIRVAIGNAECLSHTPSADEWNGLYALAKKQALVGICFAGAQKLSINHPSLIVNLSESFRLQWMGIAAKIQQQGEKHRAVIGMVGDLLTANEIEAIFMKGLVCASRYPQPELRQCGDIDFVVREEDYASTLDVLETVADVDRSLVHEHHGMAYTHPSTGSGQVPVQLEPHYKIHNYQNPWNDRMMRRLQKEVLDAPKCYVEIGGKKIRKFPMEFEGMFLVSHMVNHVYEEGLGLRQVLDYGFWINDLPNHKDFDIELYHAYLDKMHMRRAARIFTRICEKYLDVEHGIFGYGYTEKEMAFADRLMADIMAVGNFAKEVKLKAGWNAYMWTTKRALTLGHLCSSEAYWWPVSKLFRFFAKKLRLIRK